MPEHTLREESAGTPAETPVKATPDPACESYGPIPVEDAPAAIEALLFASGDPLTLDQLARILGLDRASVRAILDDMASRHARDRDRGLQLREADGCFTLATKPSQRPVLARLFLPRNRPPLSAAAYETLAVIAYNQPVTRAQIEAVRGVNSDNVLQRLVERGLVREAGTLEAPGRPTLFATSEQFLLDFGLRSVAELPPMEMLMYGTLRDIEQALEDSAGFKPDSQVTIDQIVGAFVPPAGTAAKRQQAVELSDPAAAADVLSMSSVLFGAPADEGPLPS